MFVLNHLGPPVPVNSRAIDFPIAAKATPHPVEKPAIKNLGKTRGSKLLETCTVQTSQQQVTKIRLDLLGRKQLHLGPTFH